ncbi:MAG: NADH:ubiquinone oxidoreductase [Planctomycetes bacterium]|nr:NADH:ubiquinone oxidoreductase [Planctomycetota bacterium]
MAASHPPTVPQICATFGNDPTRLVDIARQVQETYGHVGPASIDAIGRALRIPRVEVESLVTFYSFLSKQPKGRVVIRLCNDIIDRMHGFDQVLAAFTAELGIGVGQTSSDGITLETTACIGLCDQAPAALVNDVPVTELNSDRARQIVRELRKHMDPKQLVTKLGDGNNAHELVRSMVRNNIRRHSDAEGGDNGAEPRIVLSPHAPPEALRKALSISPAEVIRAIKTSRLRGRGGAGFPTGIKWEFTRAAPGARKVVICNADEGEPGTFKDRVLLTERPDRVFAGMTIAGYAIGAHEGILYLRAEYAYLRPFLEMVLQRRRQAGLLGPDLLGKGKHTFDIRIQMGAGAYVCGEETALITSCEGRRGDPKNRPPFPAQRGYLGLPTTVNNVETLCAVTKIMEEGSATFCEHGSKQSSGTKLLSISGDCLRPGVYEVVFGTPLRRVLAMAGAENAAAVQIGGPSGQMVGRDHYDRTICFDDLATGGAMMVFGPQRNLLEVVHAFLDFFADESCGFCTPCRVGTVQLKRLIEKVMAGRGEPADLETMEQIGRTMKTASRCGLGQTAANPVLSTLKNFRPVYMGLVHTDPDGYRRGFDLEGAVRTSETLTGRASIHV